MKLNKFAHACFTVTVNDQVLVVDPGGLTSDFVVPENVAGIVITHQHADHYDKELLKRILDLSSEAKIFVPKDVRPVLSEFENIEVVSDRDSVNVGEFKLDFFGEFHAVIDRDMPRIDNIGVMINEKVYYPGDSFTSPVKTVDVLALPVAAPWMRISEALEFLRQTKPRFVFPTHDAILSDAGKAIVDRLTGGVADKIGAEYKRLGDTLDIA